MGSATPDPCQAVFKRRPQAICHGLPVRPLRQRDLRDEIMLVVAHILDPEKPIGGSGSSVLVEVDLASLLSGDVNRDKQAQAAEFFDSARYSKGRYRTLAFEAKGDGLYEVAAELSLKGVTRPIRHPVRIEIADKRASATGEVVLLRREFGFGSGVFDSEQILGPEILLRFVVEASRS